MVPCAAYLVHILDDLLLLVDRRERDLDAAHAVGEPVVERESVRLADALGCAGVFAEDLVFGGGQAAWYGKGYGVW